MRAAALFFSLISLAACNREVPIRADVIYTGGTIYTGVEDGQTVEAVAVGDGVIVYTGTLEGALPASKDGAKIIRLPDNGVMFPGFTDSHVHLAGIGQRELTLNLDQVKSVEELKAAVLAYREAHPEIDRIRGRGWIETHWPEGRFPTATDLDEVVSDIPVVLTRADGHALVASTAALTAAGITAETEAPAGGEILMTEEGVPSGMLIDNAMGLVASLFTEPGVEEMTEYVRTGFEVYASRGWTGLHNMSVDGTQLEALAKLAIDNEILLRTYNAVTPDQIDAAIKRHPSGRLVTTRAMKIYMDGALGSRGALLVKPYADAPDTRGLALREKPESLALFETALEGDVQLAIHAIGDLGNKRALNWMAEAFETHEAKHADDEATEEDEDSDGYRWRIEHAQIVQPTDQARFAELGIVASMQPSHAIGDLYFAPSRLGMDRLGDAYAWKNLMREGAVIAGGSDAPVEVGDPMIEFYAATVRKGMDGFSADGWHPEQALSRFEALKLFTINAAYAAFMEDELGTIEVGKRGDFSVFDQDLMTIDGSEILKTKPLMTIVEGKTVWQAADQAR